MSLRERYNQSLCYRLGVPTELGHERVFDIERVEGRRYDKEACDWVSTSEARVRAVRPRALGAFAPEDAWHLHLGHLHLEPAQLAELGKIEGLRGIRGLSLKLDDNLEMHGLRELLLGPGFSGLQWIAIHATPSFAFNEERQLPKASRLLEALQGSPIRLRALEGSCLVWDEPACAAIHRSEALVQLEYFQDVLPFFSEAGAGALFASDTELRLRHLRLHRAKLSVANVGRLAASALTAELEELLLCDMFLCDEAVRVLLDAPLVRQLTVLVLPYSSMSDSTAERLLSAPWDRLEAISLFPARELSTACKAELLRKFAGKFVPGNEADA